MELLETIQSKWDTGTVPRSLRCEHLSLLHTGSGRSFKAICDAELAEIERRRQRYLGSRERVSVEKHTAIVIDDGIATGATTRAALRATRLRNPKKLVLAVPVAPTENVPAMREEVDDFVCLEHHELFAAIGLYYRDFRQISDEEVIRILAQFPPNAKEQETHPPVDLTSPH